jgi:hypothetical protein
MQNSVCPSGQLCIFGDTTRPQHVPVFSRCQAPCHLRCGGHRDACLEDPHTPAISPEGRGIAIRFFALVSKQSLRGALWEPGRTSRRGHFKAGTSFGLSMERYAMERCKEAGGKRSTCAENARYSDLFCLICKNCNTGHCL